LNECIKCIHVSIISINDPVLIIGIII